MGGRPKSGGWFNDLVAWLVPTGRLVAWLTVSIVLFPPLMAAVALAAYLANSAGSKPSAGDSSLTLGFELGLFVALILGAVSLIFITPERANPYEHRDLTIRRSQLETEFTKLGVNGNAIKSSVPDSAKMFADRGLRWVAGHGYLTLWTQIHAAEEALFMVEDIGWLSAEADLDLHRLKGSNMPQAEAFTADINNAVKALYPEAQQHYLGGEITGSPFAAEAARWDTLARMKLRDVRSGINEYRQSIWDGLVRARNQFLRSLIATTFITAILVDFIVLRGTNQLIVLVATVLYLVGVLVGLFGRLQGLIGSASVEEDFGLDTAHLLAVPILSGIAAVVGVVLVGLLKLKIGDINIGAPSVAAGESALPTIFNLGKNPGALIIAGLFGLTPELLIRYLKSQADTFAKGLSTTETWGKSTTTVT